MYELYGYAPEPEPVESFHDLEEAAVRCEELVHEDGYDSGEVWSTAGELVYRAGRRPASLGRIAPGVIELPASARHARPPGAARVPTRPLEQPRTIAVVREVEPPAAEKRRAAPLPVASSAPPAPGTVPPVTSPTHPVWILGDRTAAPVIWFGDSE